MQWNDLILCSTDCKRSRRLTSVHLPLLNSWVGKGQRWSHCKTCSATRRALSRVTCSVQGAGSTRSVAWTWSGPVLIYRASHPSAPLVSLPPASELPPGGLLTRQRGCRAMSRVWSQRGHVVNSGWSCRETLPAELTGRAWTTADTGRSWQS